VGKRSGSLSCHDSDHLAGVDGPSEHAFSGNSNMIQMGNIAITCTRGPFGHRAQIVHECVERGNLSVVFNGGINRSGAHVWQLYWPFLAYTEHICNPPTLSLTPHCLGLHSSECLSASSVLHHSSDLEALGGTLSKSHRLVTLICCHLLDGLVVTSPVSSS
jgi:hypothetical protein